MKSFIVAVGQKLKHLIQSSNDSDDGSNISSLTEIEVTILEQITDKLCIKGADNNPTRRKATPIRHIKQVDTWDCGLACIQMVIDWLNTNTCNNTQEEQEVQREWMMNSVKAKSLWTIDLVVLLQTMLDLDTNNSLTSSSYLFCSKQFGIDESYSNYQYYKDAFSEDESRVKSLFQKAENKSLPLMRVSHMSLNILIDLVSRENVVAIVLLDNTIFNQQNTLCPTSNDDDQPDISYSGHYVVLCGVSRDENDINLSMMNSQRDDSETLSYCLVIKNPGVWKETQFVTPSLFEASWRAKGTDEDIILVAKDLSAKD